MSLRGGGQTADDEPLVAAAAIANVLRSHPSNESLHLVAERLNTLRSPQQIDRLLSAVRGGDVDRARLVELARWLCVHATRRRTAKAGLALLGVSGVPADAALVIRLGLLEELTLYALVALENLLPDAEDSIFELAQQVENWGRIHAVHRLKDTTNPIIQDWLLRGGYQNGVMTEEVAYIAATTGRLMQALNGPWDEDLLDHAGNLLTALACGGPAEDMRDYPDAADALARYLEWVNVAAPSVDRLRCLDYLERYLREHAVDNHHISATRRANLAWGFADVLARPEWRALAGAELGCGDWPRVKMIAATAARRFGLDAAAVLRTWLSSEPHDGYLWQFLAGEADAAGMEQLIQDANTLLPLAALANGPANDLGGGRDYAPDFCLQLIIQRLREFPGIGWTALEVALRNRVTGARNGALSVLETWPRETWPRQAEPFLTQLQWTEPVDAVRHRIRALTRLNPEADK